MKELLHYEILERIGKGGMGEVYAARDTRLDRKVALKVLPAEVAADPQRRARFQQEARAVAALNHPNIVTLYSVEETPDALFLTMELIEGKALSELIPKDGLPLARFFEIAIPIADALAAAHKQGITHRDLKPANVMVTGEGRVKVLDFGLAKLIEPEPTAEGSLTRLETVPMTDEGTIVGTVEYLSPEQAEGKPVDARSDLFSLGVVLYEMATGRRPFQGDTPVSTISAILRDTPPSVTQVRETLPRHLGRIVGHCLAKDPERRFQTAVDLRNDLQGLREEIDSGELPLTMETGVVPGPPRSLRLAWGLLALAVAAGALGYGTWKWIASDGADSPGGFQTMNVTRLTATGRSSHPALSPDGKYLASVQQEEGQYSLWLNQLRTSGSARIVGPQPGLIQQTTFSPDSNLVYYISYEVSDPLRGDLYAVPLLGGRPRKVMENVTSKISFSGDGQRFSFVRVDPTRAGVLVADVEGGDPRVVASRELPDSFMSAAWSPDNRTIAVTANRWPEFGEFATVLEVSPSGGGVRALTDRKWRWIDAISWLPDGSETIVVAAEKPATGQLFRVSYPDGEVRRITNDPNAYYHLSVSSDGGSVATTLEEYQYRLWVAPLAPGLDAEQIAPEEQQVYVAGLDWTPEGGIVWAGLSGDNPQLWLAEPDGRARPLTRDDRFLHAHPCVSADGRTVVFQSNRAGGSGNNLWRLDLSGGGRAQQLTFGPFEANPQCHPGEPLVLYQGLLPTGRSAVFKVALPAGEPEVVSEEFSLFTPVISPDGTKVAYFRLRQDTGHPYVLITPLEGEGPVQELEIELESPYIRFSPNGRAIAYYHGSNLWSHPLDGGPPRQLTFFDSDEILYFAFSPDGTRVAMARGRTVRDIVLLENFR